MDTPSQHLRIAPRELDQWAPTEAAGDPPLYAFGKRLIDITIALPMVMFVLPVLMLVVALVHACLSRGPLFYRQERCGRHRRTFSIVKFRTMTPVSERQRMLEGNSESRLFSGAQLIRLSKIDEVPQFINVLRGEMSVVGPRPHHWQDCLEFESRVAGYSGRHVVKPGITGLAQVREYAGEFRWNCTDSRVAADLEYIESRTVFRDVLLMLRTLSTVVWKCLSNVIQIRPSELDLPLSVTDAANHPVSRESEEEPRRAA